MGERFSSGTGNSSLLTLFLFSQTSPKALYADMDCGPSSSYSILLTVEAQTIAMQNGEDKDSVRSECKLLHRFIEAIITN